MLSFDNDLSNALKNSNTTAFWVLKLYYNDESSFIGVSDRHRQDGTDVYYGIVASWGTLRQSLDFFNFTTSIGNLDVTLVNSSDSLKGGRFTDLLSTNNFANRKWELFLNTNETSTLDTSARMIGTGVISGEINFDRNNVTLTLLDKSLAYHKRIPVDVVSSSTYANAPTNNIGKPIPMAYGDFYEKTDIGTIPTTHFDKYYNFYKGAFPAIITDLWDVQEAGSEALADSRALHTMDAENIYFYKNGYYPTITGTIDVAGNPEIEYRGGTASVFLPISTSNLASESVTGSGAVANEENTSDGSFSTLATWTANGATSNNSVSTMTFALPQPSKLGEFGSIHALVRWGTVTDISGEDDDVFRFTANSTNVDTDSMSSDSETKTNIGNLYSGKTASWDFEGSLQYSLRSGTANESAQITESGIVVDFNIEDVEPHEVQETYEQTSNLTHTIDSGFNKGIVVTLGTATGKITRTLTHLTPSKINYIYYSGKGRKYPAFIDADSRNQGYNQNDLIENPVFIIEDMLRDELGLSSSNIDYASFDTSGNTSSGYIGDIYEDAVGDIKFALSQYKFIDSRDFVERVGKLCFSYVFISGDGKFKIKTLRRSDDYSSSDQTIDYNDLSNIKIGQTPLSSVKNDIKINYNHDYGGQQNQSEATANDSTSQGTTVSGFNQVLKIELDADEILDSTTATKLAEAYLYLLKDRKEKISFVCNRPKYNHLEIGDIIDFNNWDDNLKIYGKTIGGSWDATSSTFDGTTTTFANSAAGYFIVSDIAKNINSTSIEAIKVS